MLLIGGHKLDDQLVFWFEMFFLAKSSFHKFTIYKKKKDFNLAWVQLINSYIMLIKKHPSQSTT